MRFADWKIRRPKISRSGSGRKQNPGCRNFTASESTRRPIAGRNMTGPIADQSRKNLSDDRFQTAGQQRGEENRRKRAKRDLLEPVHLTIKPVYLPIKTSVHRASSGDMPRFVVGQHLFRFFPCQRRRRELRTSLHAAKLGLRKIIFRRPVLTALRIVRLGHGITPSSGPHAPWRPASPRNSARSRS